MVWTTKVYLDINGTNYGEAGTADVRDFEASPSGPGAVGVGKFGLIRSGGGGYSFVPRQRVKMARTDASNHFDKRLLYGVIGHLKTSTWLGTAIKEWVFRVQDVNILGTDIITTADPNSSYWPYGLAAGTFATQMQAVISRIQAAGGGSPEAIDATSQVVDLYPTMPADVLEGGHEMNWYVERLCATLYRVSGTAAGYFWGVDHTAGATNWGNVLLYVYDDTTLPASIASFSDAPTGGQYGIKAPAYDNEIDASLLYTWREGFFGPTNTWLAANNAPAHALYPCAWYGKGWGKTPLKLNVSTAAEGRAALDADVAQGAVPPQTVRFRTEQMLLAPGDVIDLTIANEGWSNVKYRVAAARTVPEDDVADFMVTEVTAGLLPRTLGRNRAVGSQPVLRDTVPPVPPDVRPTVVANVYRPLEHLSYLDTTSINSVSSDIAELRLKFTFGGADDYTAWVPAPWASPPATYALPQIAVTPGASVDLAVQGRDLSGNAGEFGPTRTVLAASTANPPPPTAIVLGADGWDSAGATKVFTFTLPSPAQTYTRVRVYPTGSPNAQIVNDIISGSVTTYTIHGATRGVGYTISLTSRNGGGDESSTPFTATFTAATEAPPAPTGLTPDQRGLSGTVGGYLKLHWTATTWPDASHYHWVITLSTGSTDVLGQGDIPRVLGVLPFAATLTGLPVNRPLRLLMYTASAYNILGPASVPLDFAILTQPSGQPPPIGNLDLTASTDQPANWTPTAGAGTSGGVDTTGAVPRLTSVLPAASVVHEWRADAFAASEGLTVQLVATRVATVATGTALEGVEWYDGDPNAGGTLISTSTVWSGTPTTGEVTAPETNQTATAPALTKAGVILLRYTGTGTASTLRWSVDPLRFRAAITDVAIDPAGITTAAKLKPSTSDAASKFFSIYDDGSPAAEVADLYYSPGGNSAGFAARAGKGAFFRDGLGNTLDMTSTGMGLGAIGDLFLAGRLNWPITTHSSTFTAGIAQTVHHCTNTITANLVTAVGIGGAIYALVNAGSGTVTVDPFSTQTVGGAATWPLAAGAALLIQSDGANWRILATTGMVNPMTTAGDLIVGGSSGTPTRLAVGTAEDWLHVDTITGLPTYFNPFTALGDLLIGGSGSPPGPAALGVGADGDVLQVVGGVPAWGAITIPPPFPAPILRTGDYTLTGAEADNETDWVDTTGLGSNPQVTLPDTTLTPVGWMRTIMFTTTGGVTVDINVAGGGHGSDVIRTTGGGDVALLNLPTVGGAVWLQNTGALVWLIRSLY